ncbi:hypothetical protein HanXRQr2_Chr16g0755291 [Helianthus annuus]|uniref:SGNH hydrolase-type esterase domain-containing protein n=1 Tax=Helianthus annuus TaxID=4232 RepID=A0A9K3DTM3_HELAN|nr:hypothetical protein HanXRQr2_Chr16g0755291 [Helianthus annuus]
MLMDSRTRKLSWGLVVVAVAFVISTGEAQDSTSVVLAIIAFGDSAVDVGNNDYLPTIFKANYPPYGRDFVNNQPTERFCNGKLATDITGTYLVIRYTLLIGVSIFFLFFCLNESF